MAWVTGLSSGNSSTIVESTIVESSIIESANMASLNSCAMALHVQKAARQHAKISFFILLVFLWGLLFSDDDTATGLMGGEDEHLGNLDVGGGIGCIDGYIGDVVTRQWIDALIEFAGAIGIALETDITEVGLHETWLEVGDPYGGVGHIDTETVGEGFHGCLRGTIYIASCIQYTLPPA